MKFLKQFLLFFIIMGVVVTCNFQLFLRHIPLTEEQLRGAAPFVFINVLFMTLIFCIFDYIIRRYAVRRPLERIQKAIDRIMQGDFDIKIDYLISEKNNSEFNQIIKGLNQMAVELGSLETLRTDFVSTVSHEMKTPLTVIQNYSTLLQTPELSEEKRQEYAKGIIIQTKKMTHMVSNVLKLSKLENQKFYPNVRTYDLGEQLCECMLLYEDAWELKELEIETDLEENVMISADEELMEQVWINLISNAVKFTDDGGKISLYLRTEDDKAVVILKDTGCGMSEDTLKNIFQKFYQGDTSHGTPGNGLGLSLVKSIINVSNGEIHVSSKEGEGSTFTVILNRVV